MPPFVSTRKKTRTHTPRFPIMPRLTRSFDPPLANASAGLIPTRACRRRKLPRSCNASSRFLVHGCILLATHWKKLFCTKYRVYSVIEKDPSKIS